MDKLYSLIILLFSIVFLSCYEDSKDELTRPQAINFDVLKKYPHQVDAFTQGLIFYDNKLIESTGLHGESHLQEIDLSTNRVVVKNKLSKEFFGEGITIFKNKLYQLTWQNNIVFVYDYPSYQVIQKFPVAYEGWGITHDNQYLIVSDGTSTLRYINPDDFKEIKQITIHDNFGSVDNINELEFVDGNIYANRWQTNHILKIDTTGLVIGILDLSLLADEATQVALQADVLNGIAYNSITKTFFVTGKKWPFLYEIKPM